MRRCNQGRRQGRCAQAQATARILTERPGLRLLRRQLPAWRRPAAGPHLFDVGVVHHDVGQQLQVHETTGQALGQLGLRGGGGVVGGGSGTAAAAVGALSRPLAPTCPWQRAGAFPRPGDCRAGAWAKASAGRSGRQCGTRHGSCCPTAHTHTHTPARTSPTPAPVTGRTCDPGRVRSERRETRGRNQPRQTGRTHDRSDLQLLQQHGAGPICRPARLRC